MKKNILIIALLLLASIDLKAQILSNDNFVYTLTPKKPVKAANLHSLTKDEMSQNVTYFDGLGRPIQTIAIGQGGGGQDLITPIEYDGFGRQAKEYLPYPAVNGSNSYPRIDSNTAIGIAKGIYSAAKYDNTPNPFSEKVFEPSPLNRVLKQAAPGASWEMGKGNEIKIDYQTNTTADAVKQYKANTTWEAGLGLYDIRLTELGIYAEGRLYKTVTYDENSGANPSESAGATVEFKNKEGQVILKRTYNSGDPHDTYYVYDIYGNLTYVLPPKVTGVVNDEVLNGLCYQYKYDYRNRLVEKKLPGKQWEFIVYDNLDRPVATGPVFSPFANETTEGWLITKYDAFGRPIYTGWSSQSSGSIIRKALQNAQNVSKVLFESKQTSGTIDDIPVYYSNTIAPTNFKLLTVTYYDNYAFPNAESRLTTIEGQTVLENVKGLVTGSWARALTTASATLGETTTTFYDTRSRAVSTRTQNHLGGYTHINSSLDFTGKSLYTITKHKRTSGDTELTVREEYTYSPQDRLLTHTHQVNGGKVEVLANNTYDDLGQLSAKNVGNSAGAPLQKVQYSYNIRGWLTGINNVENLQQNSDPIDLFAFKINYDKKPGNSQVQALYNGNIAETSWITNSDVTGAIRTYGYRYDQLNRLLDATYQTPNLTNNKNYFGENMDYDKNGNITRLLRHNIAGTSLDPYVGDMDNLGYFYTANSNQLTKVTDTSNQPQGFKDDSNGSNDLADDYAYDLNGNLIKDTNKNITEIQYNHLNLPKKITFGTPGRIEYIYNAAGQKLEKFVKDKDGVVTRTNYLGGFQYRYSEGQSIPVDPVDPVDPGGEGGDPDPPVPDDPQDPKNPPIHGYEPVPNDPPAETSRFSAFAEQSVSQAAPSRPTLEFFPTTEGYYDYVGKKYVYQYKDHLGNIRLSYAKNPGTQVLEIIEENNYYPFGLKHKGYNDYTITNNKYKFQGQERQDELGLNWDSFKYRNYDYAIGRFMSIDPLAQEYAYNSPYAFAENKLGMGRELEGLELGPLFGVAEIVKVSAEIGAKTSEVVGKTSEVSGKTSEIDFVGQEHHVIPRGVKGNEVVRDAIKEGFKFEGAENKITVEKFSKATGNGRHGNHPSYNKGVLDKLGEFGKAAEGSKTTEGSKTALDFLRNLTQDLKETIKNNPDTKINDLFKPQTTTISIDNTSVKKTELPKRAAQQAPKPKIWL